VAVPDSSPVQVIRANYTSVTRVTLLG
jgi:hypothetical protein